MIEMEIGKQDSETVVQILVETPANVAIQCR